MRFAVICLFICCTGSVAPRPSPELCKKVGKKIQKIEQRMRHGYNLRTGERLKKQLRKLKKTRYQCQKHRISTK